MASEANEIRGELSVALEGIEYTLRPTHEALVAIERKTGRSIQQLAQAAGAGSLSIEQAAVVATECIRAHGRATSNATLEAFNENRVGECLVDTGMLVVTARLELLLYLAITGGFTPTGELKARANKTATPAAA